MYAKEDEYSGATVTVTEIHQISKEDLDPSLVEELDGKANAKDTYIMHHKLRNMVEEQLKIQMDINNAIYKSLIKQQTLINRLIYAIFIILAIASITMIVILGRII